MTRNEYQLRYLEALEILHAAGKDVQDPFTTDDGVRAVIIDGFPYADDSVFALAWGEQVAENIMGEVSHRKLL
jgi:hypothetical protein